jgi:hypothetical protein
MLVLVPGKPIGAIFVSPVDSRREVLLGDYIPSMRRSLYGTVLKRSLRDSAATLKFTSHILSSDSWGIFRLRERVNCLIVLFVVFLVFSSDMPDWSRPGIFRSSPCAVALNSNVIDTTAYTEETALSPMSTP